MGPVRQRTLALATLLAGCALSAAGDVALATTGGGTGLPQPKTTVAAAVGKPFVGRYAIGEIDRGARITSGQLLIDYTETSRPFLIGNLVAYGYDRDGRASTATANLYPFRFSGGRLRASILAQGSNKRIGDVAFDEPTDPYALRGTMTWNGRTMPVVFQRLAATVGPADPLPRARLVSSVAPRVTHPGLGPHAASAYGSYALQPPRDDAGLESGMYAPLVRVATALSTRALAPVSGSLRLEPAASRALRRAEKARRAHASDGPRGERAVGVVTLRDAGGDAPTVVYLTGFRSGGSYRGATVRTGSPTGPRVGSFNGALTRRTLSGTLTIGASHADLSFRRR
jgi:hypothetical protein